MKKTPLKRVKEEFSSKEKLVDELLGMIKRPADTTKDEMKKKLRAQSNLMTVRDAPRLLVVTGLTKASDVLLVTRLAGLTDDDRVTAFWADPRFYR